MVTHRGQQTTISATLVIAGLLASAHAVAAGPPVPAAPRTLASCAGAGPAITFGLAESRTLLAPDDRDRVHAAMLERWPALQRDGFAPLHIVLWHKNSGNWVYVSLAATTAATQALCFTATFVADGLEPTPELIDKYFRRGSSAI